MNTKKQLLESHGIDCYRTSDGRLMAKSEYGHDGVFDYQWVNVTKWTIKQLLNWLGY